MLSEQIMHISAIRQEEVSVHHTVYNNAFLLMSSSFRRLTSFKIKKIWLLNYQSYITLLYQVIKFLWHFVGWDAWYKEV